MKNIIDVFLTQLGVKHTQQYTEKLFIEHPFKSNLYGLNAMLRTYGLKTIAVKYSDKENAELIFPCILHIHGDFVVANDFSDGKISYIWHGEKNTKSVKEFCEIWTGHALFCDSETSLARELDYKEHLIKELYNKSSKYLISLLPLLLCIIGLVRNDAFGDVHNLLSFLLMICGCILCYSLLQKEIYGESGFGDKVCSVFHHTDCNNVLESKWAKIGMFSWSEIGMAYFTAMTLSISLFAESFSFVSLINWCAMFFGIWSIYIQKVKVQSFCVMCAFVQGIIWLSGIHDMYLYITGTKNFSFNFIGLVIPISLLLLSFILIHSLANETKVSTERGNAISSLRAFKSNTDVMNSLLKRDKSNDVVTDANSIVFGNANASIKVTILTNPMCNPCGRMHKRIHELMQKTNNRFQIQYIFSSFNDDVEINTRFLIAVYLQRKDLAMDMYKRWYVDGHKSIKDYPESSNIDLYAEGVNKAIEYGKAWKEQTGYVATPTVLVNGYKMPEEYAVEDLEFIESL